MNPRLQQVNTYPFGYSCRNQFYKHKISIYKKRKFQKPKSDKMLKHFVIDCFYEHNNFNSGAMQLLILFR